MRWLTRKIETKLRALHHDDEAATLVFVAVVLIALLALTAFAVDFGRIWEERRQLQNGADAAAVAIAEDCARGLCDGSYDEYAVAETYVDANARDNSAWAWNVELDQDAQTVTVHNATEDPGGDNHFDMLFAGVVGFDGFTVGAEATVAWGGLQSPPGTIPIIISDCEWDRPYGQGGAGGSLDPKHLFKEPSGGYYPWDTPNPPDWWSAGTWDMDQNGSDDLAPVPVVLTFHDGATTDPCAAQAGQDANGDGMLSGGFGWLDIDDTAIDPCRVQVFGEYDEETGEYGWVGEDPGAAPSTGCDADELEKLLLGTAGEAGAGNLVFIPYFYDENGLNGQNGEYHLSGYGAFWVVGYNFGSGQFRGHAQNGPLDQDPCRPGGLRPLNWTSGNDERCLVGYFLDVIWQGTGTIGSGGRGITVIKFTG